MPLFEMANLTHSDNFSVAFMESPASSERRFERFNRDVHERLPFCTAKTSYSRSAVFEGSVSIRLHQELFLFECEANGDKSSPKTSDKLEEMVDDKSHKSVEVYLAVSGVLSQNNSDWRRLMRMVQLVSIPDSVEELCDKCFCECENLSRVTFGESSSLKLIGKNAFSQSGLVEIHIPDGVEELCEYCFYWC